MKTLSVSLILAFSFSFFENIIQGQVYPPGYMQEETGDTTNEEMTPESSVIELIKGKDCFTPLNMIDEIEDIDFRDKFGGTMLMYSYLNGCYEIAKVLLKIGAGINLKSNVGHCGNMAGPSLTTFLHLFPESKQMWPAIKLSTHP